MLGKLPRTVSYDEPFRRVKPSGRRRRVLSEFASAVRSVPRAGRSMSASALRCAHRAADRGGVRPAPLVSGEHRIDPTREHVGRVRLPRGVLPQHRVSVFDQRLPDLHDHLPRGSTDDRRGAVVDLPPRRRGRLVRQLGEATTRRCLHARGERRLADRIRRRLDGEGARRPGRFPPPQNLDVQPRPVQRRRSGSIRTTRTSSRTAAPRRPTASSRRRRRSSSRETGSRRPSTSCTAAARVRSARTRSAGRSSSRVSRRPGSSPTPSSSTRSGGRPCTARACRARPPSWPSPT